MTTRRAIRELLAEGRYTLSVGRVQEVAPLIEAQPKLANLLVELLFDEHPGVAERAADVLEKVSKRPAPGLYRLLSASTGTLLGLLADAPSKKLRWNLALTLGRLPLTLAEAERAAEVLNGWLDDPSSIVKTAALQCLADLAGQHPSLLPGVLDLLRLHGRSGTAAMRARSRLLLGKLAKTERKQAKDEARHA